MNLLIIILILLIIAIFSKFKDHIPKIYRYIFFFAILSIISSYFVLTKNYNDKYFIPEQYLGLNDFHYNKLVNAIKNKKLYIEDNINPVFQNNKIYQAFPIYLLNNNDLLKYYDLTYYKGKIYIYWGITPVLLFYLPFNLITNFCLSDSIVVLFLSSFIFILSLLILKIFTKDILNYNVSPSLQFLSVFMIGLCNYTVFLAIRPAINEVAISCAAVLLLLSIYLLLKYLLLDSYKHKNKLILFIGLFLALSVGCRPHYVLFIPVFFMLIIYFEIKTKNKHTLFKSSFYFIMPCIIYGTILALYNYLRFDSIFEFGWKYQLNHLNQLNYTSTIKDFILGFKYHLLQFPEITKNNYTLFLLVKGNGHRIGNEFITGLLYIHPLSFLLLFLPFLLKKTDRRIFILITLLTILFIINFFMACMFGMIQRYVFEYVYILVILLSIIILYILQRYLLNKYIKNLFVLCLIIVFTFTLYIHISLLFCLNNFTFIINSKNISFYQNLVQFLFDKKFTFFL